MVRLRSVPAPPSDPSIVTRLAPANRINAPLNAPEITRGLPVGEILTVRLLPAGSSANVFSAFAPVSAVKSEVMLTTTLLVSTPAFISANNPPALVKEVMVSAEPTFTKLANGAEMVYVDGVVGGVVTVLTSDATKPTPGLALTFPKVSCAITK